MSDIILSSPNISERGHEWPSPARVVIRALDRLGYNKREIILYTSATRHTIRNILHQEHSYRSRKNKVYKPYLISVREIRQYIRYIVRDWSTRRLSFEQVKVQLGIKASARTIRRELRRTGYRRCIVYPRPYISRKQAVIRLGFALDHRWWGTSDYIVHRNNSKVGADWRKVI